MGRNSRGNGGNAGSRPAGAKRKRRICLNTIKSSPLVFVEAAQLKQSPQKTPLALLSYDTGEAGRAPWRED